MFTDNLFVWQGVGVETHSVPSAASGYLCVWGNAAFVPSTSMSSEGPVFLPSREKSTLQLV